MREREGKNANQRKSVRGGRHAGRRDVRKKWMIKKRNSIQVCESRDGKSRGRGDHRRVGRRLVGIMSEVRSTRHKLHR